MANSFGLLCLAVVIGFIASIVMKDAKAFGKLMAIMLISLLVGAGVKKLVDITNDDITSEKIAVVSTESTPMHSSISPFVLEDTVAIPDCASKEIVERDSVEIEAEGVPTKQRVKSSYIDDS